MIENLSMKLHLTPAATPLPLKILLLSILILSVLSPFLGPYLALSLTGIQHVYLWQLISYPFINPFPSGLIHLAFNLYFLWIFGSSLIERLDSSRIFFLYFGSALFAAFFALLPM